MTFGRRMLLLGFALLLLGFHPPLRFDAPVFEGGGGGRYFTGSPLEELDCEACHTDPPLLALLEVERSDPPELVRDGAYVPGTEYRLFVNLVGENAGLGCPPADEDCYNFNTFFTEVLTDDLSQAGQLQNPDLDSPETTDDFLCEVGLPDRRPFALLGGERVLAARACKRDFDTWLFRWTAPEAGAGAVTFYASGVDGDGGGGGVDPYGDDVVRLKWRLCESEPDCPEAGTGGCVVVPIGRRRSPARTVALAVMVVVVGMCGLAPLRRSRCRGADARSA